MPYLPVGAENSGSIDLHYEDHGSGPPVVLIHGYPLSGRAWDKQVPVLLEAGHRAITYDRRGFGGSSQPTSGYDYDTFAADLKVLIDTLDLSDVTLVGHSMGTGEVTRYLGAYGSARVAKGVLVSPIPPYLLQADDNPEGLPGSLFEGFVETAKADTPAWMQGFCENFYNLDVLGGTLVSDPAFQSSVTVALAASATAAVACIPTWGTDSATTCRRSMCRCWSSRATPTGSCPTPTPVSACRARSRTWSWWRSTAARTPSRGPIPTRSTVPCCGSSALSRPGRGA
jgi:non-heme chloroperoxidase